MICTVSLQIIEDLMSLFDLMVAWENGNASRELEQLGFSILLAFIAQNELSVWDDFIVSHAYSLMRGRSVLLHLAKKCFMLFM